MDFIIKGAAITSIAISFFVGQCVLSSCRRFMHFFPDGPRWLLYFRLFVQETISLMMMMAGLLFSAYTVNGITSYEGGDLMLRTCAPYLILLNIWAMRHEHFFKGMLLAFLSGLLAFSIYMVKYV